MRVLCIGDVVGDPGLSVVEELLPGLRERHKVDLVVCNGENSARQGVGIAARGVRRLLAAGVDVITLGNHALRQRDSHDTLRDESVPIIRPANLPPGAPGRGSCIVEVEGLPAVAVINVLGSLFIEAGASPFTVIEELIAQARRQTDLVIVDVHAEATSEKVALAHLLDGRASLVFGTHTHVQTSDARILPGGTAYVTDIGMTGPHDSVIGVQKEIILRRFTTGIGARFDVADGGVQLEGILVELDPTTGRAKSIESLRVPAGS